MLCLTSLQHTQRIKEMNPGKVPAKSGVRLITPHLAKLPKLDIQSQLPFSYRVIDPTKDLISRNIYQTKPPVF